MAGLDAGQLLRYVIRPTLEGLNLGGEAAEELVLGTALHESGSLRYLRQINGPALGLWQMEPATHDDIWNRWLINRPVLNQALRWLVPGYAMVPSAQHMVWNLAYACAMCRIAYRRVPEPLPEAGDLGAQARYWKAWYNTRLGAGLPEQYVSAWQEVMT